MKIIFAIAAAFSAAFLGSAQITTAISSSRAGSDAQPLSTQTVYVQNRGQVDISSLVCDDGADSSGIRHVCYDVDAAYVLVSVNGAYRQYCGIDRKTLSGLLLAPSMDRYFDEIIKGRFICPASETAGAG
jgi:hypothetical protein